MRQQAINRYLALASWAVGVLYVGARGMLDLLGYTTAFDDAQLLRSRLPQWLAWLFSTPWWVPAVLLVGLTAFVVWICWPRRIVRALTTEEALNEGINVPSPTQFAARAAIRLLYRAGDPTPDLLSQENIFRYYSLRTGVESVLPDGTRVPYMVMVLFLVYDRPIRQGNIRVKFGSDALKYEIKDFGSRHAVICFTDIPKDISLEVETY